MLRISLEQSKMRANLRHWWLQKGASFPVASSSQGLVSLVAPALTLMSVRVVLQKLGALLLRANLVALAAVLPLKPTARQEGVVHLLMM